MKAKNVEMAEEAVDLQYLEREPMILGILRVARLLVQSTFWRFLSPLHLTVAVH